MFCRSDSIYRTFPEADVYDESRGAFAFAGGVPVVAHPPCRGWGRLRHLSKAPLAEHGLALWAVEQVRRYGGVLEHPSGSALWSSGVLPAIGEVDAFGGYTIGAHQRDFGHLAEKRTLLYICGVEPGRLPAMPLELGYPTHCVHTSKRGSARRLLYLSQKAIESTPVSFARWLLSVAKLTKRK